MKVKVWLLGELMVESTVRRFSYLGQFWLGEARLAHLRRLAHVDVALCQGPLGEGLGSPVLAGLTRAPSGPLAAASHPSASLPSSAPRFTLHGPATCGPHKEKVNTIGDV